MRVVNLEGRLGVVVDGRVMDVSERSGGKLPEDPMAAFSVWSELRDWAAAHTSTDADPIVDPSRLGPPVPRPSQVFAIGLNYRDHAEEAGFPIPETPMIFTKFPSCLVGPEADIPLTSNRVDWEVELVVVMGRVADRVTAAEAYDYVAGFCAGQDISDRRAQFKDQPAQFSFGKSAKAFGPIGPALVSLDEIANPDAIRLRCSVDDEVVQESTTANLIFSVPQLIEEIAKFCVLQPGDLIFTGTPAGVGSSRDPRRYLEVGETIRSSLEGIGELTNRCVAGDS